MTKIILVQLGSPRSPKVTHVRSYLKEFLLDPRVVDLNPIFWRVILYLFILPFRPFKSSKAYARIFDGKGFPLVTLTEKLKSALSLKLSSKSIKVESAYLLCSPRVSEVVAKEAFDQRTPWIVLPMFPQYSSGTTASVFDQFEKVLKKYPVAPDLHMITTFHRFKSFIDAEVRLIEKHLKESGAETLILSFHGLPKQRVIEKGDPYYRYCYETYLLIKERLSSLHQERIHISFQSRFGKDEWLTPYTGQLAELLIKKGEKKIAVHSPSFLIDCLETLDELGHGLAGDVKRMGGELIFIPSLNDDPFWTEALALDLERVALGTPVPKYSISEIEERIPPCRYESTSRPLSVDSKNALKAIFVTLFLDLVGFSIIFPLFPSIAQFYLKVDADNFFIQLLSKMLSTGDLISTVLFGGFLGALYSFLQFLTSPFWGALSDRIGRKRTLQITIFGTFVSYLLWIFSSSFTLFLFSRALAGAMGGNISVATALASDVTTKETRSKGMAIIGIAFALGFILGPAIGGILSLIDLTKLSFLSGLSLTPFSMPAVFAALLSILNLWLLKRIVEKSDRKISGEKIRVLPHLLESEVINWLGLINFIYILAFSGMEFTLTFLAHDRLGFTAKDIGFLFIFVGTISTIVQGGFVRRKAHEIGERKLSIVGFLCVILGFVLLAIAFKLWVLLVGLLFLSAGAAMVIPTLPSQVSFFAGEEKIGVSMGFFRSMGSLARVFGPIAAALIYDRVGSSGPYLLGAIILLFPIAALILKVPATNLKRD